MHLCGACFFFFFFNGNRNLGDDGLWGHTAGNAGLECVCRVDPELTLPCPAARGYIERCSLKVSG